MRAAFDSGFIVATASLAVVAGWAVGWCHRWTPSSSHDLVQRAEGGGSRTLRGVLPAAPTDRDTP